MSFDVHPILEPGQTPKKGVWYAISPEAGHAGPSARVGAGAICLPGENGGRVLLTAGATLEGPYGDLFELRIGEDSIQWCSLPSRGLPPRYEHATFLVGTEPHVFGGAEESGPLSDVWKYDPALGQWCAVRTTGSPPSPCTFHSSTSARGKSLLVFSGGSTGNAPVADRSVYVFDTATSEWTIAPTSGYPPSPRQGHIAAVVGNRLVIHGGMAGEEIYSDLHILDLDKWVWSQPKVKGDVPPPLAAHGCAVVGGRVYVFGGLSYSGACDDLYCLDTDSLSWKKVPVSGPPPPARLDHAMSTILLPLLVTPQQLTDSCTGTEEHSEPDVNATEVPSQAVPKQREVQDPKSQSDCTKEVQDPKSQSDRTKEVQDPTSQSDCTKSHDSPVAVAKTVTVIDATNPQSCVIATSGTGLASTGSDVASASEKLEELNLSGGKYMVHALFMFGGMDTIGNIHGDAFIIVPPE